MACCCICEIWRIFATVYISPSILIFSALVLLLVAYIIYLHLKLSRTKRHSGRLEEDYRKLENRINSHELEELRYKINPHLFKNILNSIQSHAYQTYFSLDKLSNVLDYILYETDKRFVSVREEVSFAENLIGINQLKLSPLFDIRVKKKISENHPLYEQELLAPMISVDLIGNAFKHADLQGEDAFIAITFELKDDFFTLTVANKISAKPALKRPNSGLGRETMKKRLDIIYKECYQLDQFEEDGVYISHLKLNLLEYKAKVLAAG